MQEKLNTLKDPNNKGLRNTRNKQQQQKKKHKLINPIKIHLKHLENHNVPSWQQKHHDDFQLMPGFLCTMNVKVARQFLCQSWYNWSSEQAPKNLWWTALNLKRFHSNTNLKWFAPSKAKNGRNQKGVNTCRHNAASRVFRMQVKYKRNEVAWNYSKSTAKISQWPIL